MRPYGDITIINWSWIGRALKKPYKRMNGSINFYLLAVAAQKDAKTNALSVIGIEPVCPCVRSTGAVQHFCTMLYFGREYFSIILSVGKYLSDSVLNVYRMKKMINKELDS